MKNLPLGLMRFLHFYNVRQFILEISRYGANGWSRVKICADEAVRLMVLKLNTLNYL